MRHLDPRFCLPVLSLLLSSGSNQGNSSTAPGSFSKGSKPGGSGEGRFLGLSTKSRRTVLHLSILFAFDSFGGAMITGTLLAYYFQVSVKCEAAGMEIEKH